jgi:hypothetical protein
MQAALFAAQALLFAANALPGAIMLAFAWLPDAGANHLSDFVGISEAVTSELLDGMAAEASQAMLDSTKLAVTQWMRDGLDGVALVPAIASVVAAGAAVAVTVLRMLYAC